MDITLERILSLIPKKENGDFQHGSQKAFANSIGLKSGNLIADWIKGRSESYTNYLYEISAKYNVSLEWLRGETADPAPKKERTMSGALSDAEIQLLELFRKLPKDTQERFPALLEATLKAQGLL